MSNFTKDQPSIRVFAPPGGRSTNIFGAPEPELPISTKKNHMESDIFGCKKDNTDSAPAKPARSVTNNIYGADVEQPAPKSSIYSDKNKSTIFDEAPRQQPSNKPDRQRSNIFGANEPMQSAPTRPVSDKYKSSIFGAGDDDTQAKRQGGTRQGLRVGYNPINGESYSTKDGLNSKVETTEVKKESEQIVKTAEEANGEQVENGKEKEETNGNVQPPTENGETQEPAAEKPSNGHSNGHSTAKNPPTNVRVCHPPGGRSNGPLW